MFLLRRSSLRVTLAQLLADAEAQIAQGVPRQEICHQWLDQSRRSPSIEELRVYEEAERQLFGEMVARNLQAAEYERTGDLDAALAAYEANVRDRFVGATPYQRLQVLYLARGDYDNALRVARAHTQQLARFHRPISWENDTEDGFQTAPRLRLLRAESA